MNSSTAQALLLVTVAMLLAACTTDGGNASLPAPPTLATQVDVLAAAERGELGKPTIVFFHAEWCQICQKARPDLDALTEQYADQIAMVPIDMDDTASLPAIQRYQVRVTPTFVLLSAKGELLTAFSNWPGKSRMERAIAKMLEAELTWSH